MKGVAILISRASAWKSSYRIRLELGLILTLLIMITGSKIQIQPVKNTTIYTPDNQEVVEVREIVQTKQELKAPPPPRPVVPVEVPNDEIIENEVIDLDAELNIEEIPLKMPPPPPKQEEPEEEEQEIFVVVEQMPELIGGLASIQKHIEYPEMARKAGIEGRVVVEFVIDTTGYVTNPIIIRGIGGGCDEAALQAVKKARFKPGKQRGIPVMVRYSLPISFSLSKHNR
ncbi:energy transducer TonB [Gracilimonas mengyeensis]|uniref:Protein TonB n=1 Tax=Gracilimonas mengyeensis TaxID=1302730 RepID=A0A521AQM5_9BACT|nr:energy transducer TonB [Gracilimonas mengyeensis]SMO37061.1 protein TonB [Gracilimonas mengyeensis]